MSPEEQILERLERIEAKLERLTAYEEQWRRLGEAFENLRDMGRDLSLLTPPAVRLLTEELAEVETGFQLEDFFYLLKRVLLSLRHLAWALEQLENLRDWWADVEPLLKIAVPHLIDKLDDLEQKGIFRINQAMLNMYAKLAQAFTPEDIEAMGDGFVRLHSMAKKFADPVVTRSLEAVVDMYAKLANVFSPEDIEAIGDGFVQMHGIVKKFADPVVIKSLEAVVNTYAKLALTYTPEDIEAIGEGFVKMHGIVKKFADPRVIEFLDRLTDVPVEVDLKAARPVGPLGMPFRMMSRECKEGLGVALELTRALGRVKPRGNGLQTPSTKNLAKE